MKSTTEKEIRLAYKYGREDRGNRRYIWACPYQQSAYDQGRAGYPLTALQDFTLMKSMAGLENALRLHREEIERSRRLAREFEDFVRGDQNAV